MKADCYNTSTNRTLDFDNAFCIWVCVKQIVYFLQHELGFNTLGLADDEYPTADKLPFIPYHSRV